MDHPPVAPNARLKETLEPTPSVGGYVAAALIAVVLGSVLIAAIMLAVTANIFTISGFLATTGVIGVVATLAALVLGMPLAALVHFRVRSVRAQWIHVAAFSAVGAVVGSMVVTVLLHRLYPAGVAASMVVAVTVAAAVGRLCVSGRRWRQPWPFDR